MRGQVKSVSAAFLNQIFDLLFKEEYVIRISPHPRLAFETVFFKLFQIEPALSIDTLIEKLDALGHRVGSADPEKKDTRDADAALSGNIKQPAEDSETVSPGTDLDRTWASLIHILSENNPAFTASLRKCGLKKIDGKSLEIEVADNGFSLNMIRRTKNMSALKKACKTVFGKQMDIKLTAKESTAGNNQTERETAASLKQTALSHPLVTTAMEIFDGKLVDVKILR
jgi:DNA polymerase-3 subunit gamma/tau